LSFLYFGWKSQSPLNSSIGFPLTKLSSGSAVLLPDPYLLDFANNRIYINKVSFCRVCALNFNLAFRFLIYKSSNLGKLELFLLTENLMG